MFVRAKSVKFLDGVNVELTFIDGSVVLFDMSKMFAKYPQLKALENRKLFESGHLDPGGYGIIWNDELDFSAQSIYEGGKIIRKENNSLCESLGFQIMVKREQLGMTQIELAHLTGIDQADISRLERGLGNPSLAKIEKILNCLNAQLKVT